MKLKRAVVLAQGVKQKKYIRTQPRSLNKTIPTRTLMPKGKHLHAHKPRQILVTKSGKKYIVGTDVKYVPMTSKKHARREATERMSKKSNKAHMAGSLQFIDGQTYVVGEDRKTFIPITKNAASGKGVLTTLLEIVVVVAITDLVVDLIEDDVLIDGMNTTYQSFDNSGNFESFEDTTLGWTDAGNLF